MESAHGYSLNHAGGRHSHTSDTSSSYGGSDILHDGDATDVDLSGLAESYVDSDDEYDEAYADSTSVRKLIIETLGLIDRI